MSKKKVVESEVFERRTKAKERNFSSSKIKSVL